MSRLYSVIILFTSIFICFVAISQVSAAQRTNNKRKCTTEEKNEIDAVVARIMTYGREDRKFPLSATELKKYCKEQNRLLARLEDYKEQCLKAQSKQIVSVIVYSIKASITKYCKNPNAKHSKELIISAQCANSASHEYLNCNNNYIDLLMAVEDSKDSKLQLAQMCCGYVEVFKCIREGAARHPKVCSEEKVEINSNYIRGYFDNAINVICGEYNEQSDKCDKFTLVRKGKGGSKKHERPVSYFSPLVKVLANL